MAYTVKKLAEMSGVSIRTLHFYDEIGLLRPAYHGTNGYRFYEEEQLLILQQILFFRELGFELKQIQKVIGKKDFDKIAALASHRQVLMKSLSRTKELIKTIDKTIKHLKGTKKMKEEDMYEGFTITKEKQAEYLTYLKNRLGEEHPSFAECEKNSKKWTQMDTEKAKKEGDATFREFAKLKEKQVSPSSPEVQALVLKLYNWVKQFWTPDKVSFPALGQMYTELEWKKFFGKYDPQHPKLAMFVAEGMRIFAERELN
jgi:MerR family transcriptional regulator, thiopeptide resistance regulator